MIDGRRGLAAAFAGLFVAHVVFGWVAVWTCYNFKYSARANPADAGLVIRRFDSAPVSGPVAGAVDLGRRWHFLPEGFLIGSASFLNVDDVRPAFMDGRWKLGGWRTFFPYAIGVKTPPALFLLLPFGLAVWWWSRHRPPVDPVATGLAPPLYAATPLLALLTVYGAAAMAQNLNIGHRHILPLYPALYVLAGSAALGWSGRARWANAGVGLLALWFAASSFSIRPNYLAYFNAFAGGPAEGYRHLVDSSLDWGMDLPGLKRWLAVHNPEDRVPFFLAYFGTDSPEFLGIKNRRLPGFTDWFRHPVYPLEPGYYAISATLLESVYTQTFGPWNRTFEDKYQKTIADLQAFERTPGNFRPGGFQVENRAQELWAERYDAFDHLRLGRLCAWLRVHRPPDDSVGYSILIWKLSQEDLDAALFGPPAELRDAPAKN